MSKQSIAQLQAFYQAVDFAPLWQDAAQRQQLAELILDTQYDGLEPAMYQLPPLLLSAQVAAEQRQVCDELLLSHGYLQVLQHLRDGILDPETVEPYWHEAALETPEQLPIAEVAAAGLPFLPQVFAAVRPQHSTYQKLREVLKDSDLLNQPDWGSVPVAGKSLRVGMQDVRVPDLRQRLQLAGYIAASTDEALTPVETVAGETVAVDSLLYTDELAAAVKAFQQDHYLEDDGIVGPATLRELNITPEQRLMQVRVNLERLRWLDKLLEPTMLVVDIAGARLLYFRDGDIVWRTRTQVGTVRRQTPLLKSRITHLTINPTWTVPPTILREDKLPAIRRDIGYLARSNMSVLDYNGNVLDPYSVNWQSPSGIMLRQGPGPSNALGLVAIRFANPFTVYLHDTPSQHLFGRATRTVSSGCVRVEDAQRLVDHLLFAATAQERQRIEQIQASGKTRNVNLPQPVPVLLAYWTVEVDMDNRLRFRSDNYGHDTKVAAALQAAQQR
ncbi:L,D-transpeptidase family protein [Denitrificimonas caeni]|uniref:L,D-transpeptidase family protein n=1 Tax=Denitrificimonas caeni TaxID=521720 RepID=A0AAE9VQE3_9GAMM|nr:L,D-transpeptidase family protein [Denitrificimonas caeni]WBE26475.1 L,D-transpeptidase family protein [Denitrificimonas caeni]